MVYGIGALVAAASPGLGVLIVGYSFLQGIGTALLIPPVYILATVFFTETRVARPGVRRDQRRGRHRRRGRPADRWPDHELPTSWRLAFVVQALLVGRDHLSWPGGSSSRRRSGAKPTFDLVGAVLSAAGLFFIVVGILQTATYGWLTGHAGLRRRRTASSSRRAGSRRSGCSCSSAPLLLVWFFCHIRSMERAGKEPLLATRMFLNRRANLGLITQNIQWLVLLGLSFVVSVFLQTVRGLQRHRDRPDPDARDDRHPGVVDGRGRLARALPAGDPDPGRVRR